MTSLHSPLVHVRRQPPSLIATRFTRVRLALGTPPVPLAIRLAAGTSLYIYMRKLIIAAAPCSGTSYIAKVLQKLGLNIGHEKVFYPSANVTQFPGPNFDKWDGDSSWLSVPHLGRCPKDALVVHQVRNPLHVIRSLLAVQFFNSNTGPIRAEYYVYAKAHAEKAFYEDTELLRACSFYCIWNKWIERVIVGFDKHIFHHIEKPLYEQIMLTCGKNWKQGDVGNAEQQVPKNENTDKRPKDYHLDWGDLTPEVREMAEQYGYDTGILHTDR